MTSTTRRLESELAALGGSLRTRSKRTHTIAISTWARSSNPSIVDLTHLGGGNLDNRFDADDSDVDPYGHVSKYNKITDRFGMMPFEKELEDRGGVGFLPYSVANSDSSTSSSSSITVYCPGFDESEKHHRQHPTHDNTSLLNGKVSARVDDAFEIVPAVVLLRELKHMPSSSSSFFSSSPTTTTSRAHAQDVSVRRLSSMNDGVIRAVQEPLSQWLHGFDSALLLVGQRGTGKSTLAYGAPALLPSGVTNRSLLAGGGVIEGGGINGYSPYAISGGKGRPSLCGLVIDSALAHVRASNNRHESLRFKSQHGTYSASHSSNNNSSNSASLCISMWSVSCEDDSIRDLLNRFSPSSSSSSLPGVIPSSFNEFSPIKVSVKTEEEARRVIASGLIRCGGFEATRLPVSSSSNNNISKVMDVLMPLPSLSHVFVSFELTSSLDVSISSSSSSSSSSSALPPSILLRNDSSAVGSLTRRTLTLVDLAGSPTVSASHPSNGGNPTLRIRALDQRAYAMLPTQLLSLDRLVEEVAAAQRAAGIMMMQNNSHPRQQQSQSHSTIQAQLVAASNSQQRRNTAFKWGKTDGRGQNDENASPPPPPHIPSSSSPPLFRVDRDNNDPHGPGIGGGKRSSSSSSSSTNSKAIGLHLRDTILSRSLAPLIAAGNVLCTVVGTVSSSKSDEANNKTTIRLLSSIGRIVSHAVRNDILAPLSASRSIEEEGVYNDDYDGSVRPLDARRRDGKVMKLKRRRGIMAAEEWWEEHGFKISETPSSSSSSSSSSSMKRPSSSSSSHHHEDNNGIKSESATDHHVNLDILNHHSSSSPPPQALNPQSSPLSPSAPPYASAPSVAATAFGAAYRSELEHHQALVGGALSVTEERERKEREEAQQRDNLLAIEAVAKAAVNDTHEQDARRRAPASRAIISSTSVAPAAATTTALANLDGVSPPLHSATAPSTTSSLSSSSTRMSVEVQTVPEPITVLQPLSVDWRPSYYELSKRALDGTLSGGTLQPKKVMKDASTSSIIIEIDKTEEEKVIKATDEAPLAPIDKVKPRKGLSGKTHYVNTSSTIPENDAEAIVSSSSSTSSLLLSSSAETTAVNRRSLPISSQRDDNKSILENNRKAVSNSLSSSSSSSIRGVGVATPTAGLSSSTSSPSSTLQSTKKSFPASSSTYAKLNNSTSSSLSHEATTGAKGTLNGGVMNNASLSSTSTLLSPSPSSIKGLSSSSAMSPTPTPIAVLLTSTTPQSAIEIATRLSRSAIDEEDDDDEEEERMKIETTDRGKGGGGGVTPKKSLLKLANRERRSTNSTSMSPSIGGIGVGGGDGEKSYYSSVSPALNRSSSRPSEDTISAATTPSGKNRHHNLEGPSSSSSSPFSPPLSPQPPPLPSSSSSSSSAVPLVSSLPPTERSASRTSVYASFLEHQIGVYYNEEPNTSSEEEEEGKEEEDDDDDEEEDVSSIEVDEEGIRRRVHHKHKKGSHHHTGSSDAPSSSTLNDNDDDGNRGRNSKLARGSDKNNHAKDDDNDDDDDDDGGYLSSEESSARKLFNTAYPALDLIKRSNRERMEREKKLKQDGELHHVKNDHVKNDHVKNDQRHGKPPPFSVKSSDRDFLSSKIEHHHGHRPHHHHKHQHHQHDSTATAVTNERVQSRSNTNRNVDNQAVNDEIANDEEEKGARTLSNAAQTAQENNRRRMGAVVSSQSQAIDEDESLPHPHRHQRLNDRTSQSLAQESSRSNNDNYEQDGDVYEANVNYDHDVDVDAVIDDKDEDEDISNNVPLLVSPLTPPPTSSSLRRRSHQHHTNHHHVNQTNTELNTRSSRNNNINTSNTNINTSSNIHNNVNISSISTKSNSSSSRVDVSGGVAAAGRSVVSGGVAAGRGGSGGGSSDGSGLGLLSPRTNARFAALDRDLESEERRVESELLADAHSRRPSKKVKNLVVVASDNGRDGDGGLFLTKSSLEASVDSLTRRLASLSSEVANMTGRVKVVASSEKRASNGGFNGGGGGISGGLSTSVSMNNDLTSADILAQSFSSSSSSFLVPPPSLSSLSPPRASSSSLSTAYRLPLSPALIRYSTSRFHASGVGGGGGRGVTWSSANPLNASSLSTTTSSSSLSFVGDMASPTHARSAFSSIRDSPRSLLNAAAKAREFAASIRQRSKTSSSL